MHNCICEYRFTNAATFPTYKCVDSMFNHYYYYCYHKSTSAWPPSPPSPLPLPNGLIYLRMFSTIKYTATDSLNTFSFRIQAKRLHILQRHERTHIHYKIVVIVNIFAIPIFECRSASRDFILKTNQNDLNDLSCIYITHIQ